jgi:hypothetical protein
MSSSPSSPSLKKCVWADMDKCPAKWSGRSLSDDLIAQVPGVAVLAAYEWAEVDADGDHVEVLVEGGALLFKTG